MSMPELLDALPRRVAGWAVNRSLAPTSMTGISLALALCAAAWFSAGTRPGNVSGSLALFASYLAGRAARWLAGPGAAGAGTARSGVSRAARAGAATVAELCDGLSDCVVYAGLAVGGYEAHWSGTWELAVSVVIAMAVRRTAARCCGQAADTGGGSPVGRAIREFLAFSPGGRVTVIVIAAPVWGAHATLLALLEWGIIATAYVITGPGPRLAAAEPDGPAGRAVAAGSPAGIASPVRAEPPVRAAVPARAELPAGPGSPAAVMDVTDVMDVVDMPVAIGPPVWADARMDMPAALTPLASAAGPPKTPPPLAGATEATMTLELMIHHEAGPGREPEPPAVLDPRARAAIAAYRDDGVAAVWLSRVVRGQFVPLPPAVAGLVATSFLAWLGMRNLPGLLLLTPLAVLLLAAFGSGHPHDGRLDWLVPAVLVAGQLVYVAAVGFSFGVPAPVTFTLCSLIALRYVGLDRGGRARAAADTRLGWEGRMLAAGIGAMLGITTIAFLALAAYVAVLVGGRAWTSLLPAPGADLR